MVKNPIVELWKILRRDVPDAELDAVALQRAAAELNGPAESSMPGITSADQAFAIARRRLGRSLSDRKDGDPDGDHDKGENA